MATCLAQPLYLFFNLSQCVLLIQFTSWLTTSAFSVLGSLLFLIYQFFKVGYSFHLFNTASELTIILPYSSFKTLTCCTSFLVLSLYLASLYNSFSPFFSNLAHKSSYAHPFAIVTAFFALPFFSLYIFLLFSSLILSHAFFASFFSYMLSCTFSLHHHVSLSPSRFPNVTPSTVSAVFLSISAVLSDLSGNPSSPSKILVSFSLNAS